MTALTITPNRAAPGSTVDIDGTGFDPRVKFQLATVDDLCQEVGITTNINRPKRNGTFSVGINVPPMHGTPQQGYASIRAYQRGVKVAEAMVRVG